MSEMTIALLGQPNCGKSTLFNALTGSHQHVGNWPGKTVEQKEGYFAHENKKYKIVDLPGTYSLSANSEEEIVTREYIASVNADVVCLMADASQIERSLFMLADYAGIKTPVFLLLNMMDVATEQGKTIDSKAIEKKIGIPVVPITAADKDGYGNFYRVLEETRKSARPLREESLLEIYKEVLGQNYEAVRNLMPSKGVDGFSATWLAAKLFENDAPVKKIVHSNLDSIQRKELEGLLNQVENGNLQTADAKFKWIESILKNAVRSSKNQSAGISRFDRIATSKTWGKPIAVGVVVLGLILTMVIAMPLVTLANLVLGMITPAVASGLTAIGTPHVVVSLICDGILTAVSFSFAMAFFVFGISIVFGFIEEIGYMARISYVFDGTMSSLGLQGKAVMPFLVSFGCTIGGVSGTRVIDSWGQRVATIALSWVVPCAATWSVVGLVSAVFFGSSAFLVILSLFAVAFVHMYFTSRIFGKHLIKESDKTGLIMELPPYHKPKYGNLFRFVMNRMGDVVIRALKTIVVVSVLFWAMSYTADGDVTKSIIYKIGTYIEPVTMWFGLRWQTFMAFISAAMGKEAALGVLAALLNTTGQGVGIFDIVSKSATVSTTGLGNTLSQTISKPEALAFIYAFFFNVPCLMAVATTYQETHSLKWTLRIVAYYLVTALAMATIVYHIGLMIF